MQCVILAGGLGTRMWPEAKTTPKTLLPVAGKPFAHWQLSWLAASGVTSVLYCTGYLGGQIRDYVGDGSTWGLVARYADEGDALRGTASALRSATARLADDFLVLNGDTLPQADPAAVMLAAQRRGEPALMTVCRSPGCTGNVVRDGDRVARYAKGRPGMCWTDCGLLAFRREVISRVPAGVPADLEPLLSALAAEGLLAALETGRFHEIGSVAGRDELQVVLERREVKRAGQSA
jgi:NDP-sugar pyrophosphorylase family protein